MNRAARIITGNFEYDIRGLELLRQPGLMNLKERHDYFMNLLVLKCVKGIAPSYLCDVLTPAASIQTRESTSSAENLLYVPCVNCHLFKQSFEYRTLGLWNSLPSGLWNSLSSGLWNSLPSGLWKSLPSGLWNSLPSGLWNSLPSGLWNSLPSHLRNAPSVNDFKRLYKRMIF